MWRPGHRAVGTTEWVTRIRESTSRLTPSFSVNQTLREYTQNYYLPAAAAYHERARDHGPYGKFPLQWEQALVDEWVAESLNAAANRCAR
jgi:glycogen phosphorylase